MLLAAGLVAAGLAGADLVAGRIARRRVAGLIAVALRTAAVPGVRFGRPFLPQLMRGRFREVGLRVPAFTAGGVGFGGLDASLTGVRAPVRELRAGRGVLAGELTATVTIPFESLGEQLPPGFTIRRHGVQLRVHGWALAVPVTGTVDISANRRCISVNPRVAGIPSLVGFLIEIPALPPEVTIASISLADTAVTVGLAGREVRLSAGLRGDDPPHLRPFSD